MTRTFALFLLVVGLVVPFVRGQQPNAKDLVKFELFASVDAPMPGKPFTLAIRARIQKPWHIYWLNPGDSGMATAFKLKLPDGWKAGEVQFPIPHKFDQPGGFVGYGYVDEAVFLVDVLPSPDAKPGAKVEVECVYLVCDTICLPGRQAVEMGSVEGRWHRQSDAWFATLRSAMPTVFTGSNVTDGPALRTEGKLTAAWSPFQANLIDGYPAPILPGHKSPTVEVFPLLDDAVELRNVTASVDANDHASVKFEARLLPGTPNPPEAIRLLVVYTDAKGARPARWVSVPTK